MGLDTWCIGYGSKDSSTLMLTSMLAVSFMLMMEQRVVDDSFP